MRIAVDVRKVWLVVGALCLPASAAWAGLVATEDVELIPGAAQAVTEFAALPLSEDLAGPSVPALGAWPLPVSAAALAKPLAAGTASSPPRVSTAVDLSLWSFVNIVLAEQGNRQAQILQSHLRVVELASTDLPSAVPLPGGSGLFLLGAIGLGAARWRATRRRRQPA